MTPTLLTAAFNCSGVQPYLPHLYFTSYSSCTFTRSASWGRVLLLSSGIMANTITYEFPRGYQVTTEDQEPFAIGHSRLNVMVPVSYTHLTLPPNREV